VVAVHVKNKQKDKRGLRSAAFSLDLEIIYFFCSQGFMFLGEETD